MRQTRLGGGVLLAALTALLLLLPSASPASAAAQTAAAQTAAAQTAAADRAAALPTHFALGLSAQPDATGLYGWLPNSGVPWDYAYQYLAGGVNTGSGWQTWNANADFPLLYAQGAAGHGYVPVFSYYQLQQSNGPCNTCGEAARDLANLAAASTMAAYYADFAALMRKLGPSGFAHTAVVHVEPDLSGFAEQAVLDPAAACYGHCTGSGNDPALLQASVASSGAADVAGYANTYQGFSLALAHLRDLYAPNVLLAFHVSDWATRVDVGSSHDTSLDAAGLGAEAGRFAAAAGASAGRYDLVFNDVADRDAGYSKNVLGQDRWWDRANRVFPNFTRWEAYVQAVGAATGEKVMVWQVPLGNQRMLSDNDTDGHYQDNRVEYFLAHPAELAAAGVVGVLFGRGNGGSTTYDDDKADGVTNPAPLCTTDGSSTGPVCTSGVATVADDDGGYLRSAAAAYYRAPLSLAGPTPSPSPAPAPVPPPVPSPVPVPAPAPVPAGWWEVASDGGIFSYGGAQFFGSTGSLRLNKPIVGMAATPSGRGYWLVASDGGIFSYGDARFFGSTGSLRLNRPIVGMAATPSGRGYWLVASDGGIFSYGDARFFGSTGSLRLNRPIVGVAATPSGAGYWLVASDGGIFSYGDARFFGSTGSLRLNRPIVGMAATPSGAGYWLVASDGGIFSYGDAHFFGSTGSSALGTSIVGISAASTGGYRVAAANGASWTFAPAGPSSTAALALARPVVGLG